MTRTERERRNQQLEYEAQQVVSLLTQHYRLCAELQRARGLSEADILPLESSLCSAWKRWERLIRPELRELVTAQFWDEGIRQEEAWMRANEERYGQSNDRGA